MTMSNNTPEQKDSQNSKQRNPKAMKKKADEAMVLNSAYPLFWFGSYIVHALR